MTRDRFQASLEKNAALKKAEQDGLVADSMEYRMALMKLVHSGEITLEFAQNELKKVKRMAKKNGKLTRSRVWRES